ncbi:acyl-CoA dehydrogenase [Massilia sp. WF1]|uniref:FAS1-like dehydratase domain-containing protein n=1 Tax=unclassified Massilia TaxID=2609279 RepID=UPI000649A603|nr:MULTISPECIES: MaoC family dehydratase N-terminal domain-containing protein [unclassified Massilia]ALK99130.1 acyl-CoA dehydrogenase [Massilia sp. WG5]KLU35152.1 acyl-CoA dehydrogenase [Massilia sp. WF1]
MTSEAFDETLLQQWVGRTETVGARVNAVTANAMAATLDRPDHFGAGAGLPPLWHWAYFWHAAPQAELGPDGHPQRGGFLPPVPLPRRMWAGGRLTFNQPLTVEGEATRSSQVKSVGAKQGTTGPLVFVTVRHELAQDGAVCVTEEHDIVYREMPQPGAPAPASKMAPAESAWERSITPDPVLLFRYSALTFNGHRIHYDRSYVTEVEGYPGLIVHGPLIATLLVDLLQRNMPQARIASFSFRAVGPLFDIEPFTVCGTPDPDGRTVRLWARNIRGELAMQAEAVLG